MKHESSSLALWSEELVILSQELNQRVWACKEFVWENVPKKEPVPWGQTQTLILARPPAEGLWTSSRTPLRFSLLICLRAEWRKWYSDRKLLAHNKCPPKCQDRSTAIFTVKFVGQLKEHMIWRLMLPVESWTLSPISHSCELGKVNELFLGSASPSVKWMWYKVYNT